MVYVYRYNFIHLKYLPNYITILLQHNIYRDEYRYDEISENIAIYILGHITQL